MPDRRTRLPIPAVVLCAVLGSFFPVTLGHDASPFPLFVAELSTEAKDRPVAAPAELIIRRLRLRTPIESLGVLDSGNLDTPKNPQNAGWWTGGAKPGERGMAVIDGHLNFDGKPAVFRNLDRLRVGDAVVVRGEDGQLRRFVVRAAETYHVDDAPLQKIFRPSDDEGRYLNLITCAGEWDDAIGHYDQRLVVYAELADL